MIRMNYQDDRTAEHIVTGVYESLDNMQGRIERKITLLDTAKHLVGDYCMTYLSSKHETPRELKLVIDLLDLIMSDCTTENDMLADYNKELDTAINRMS